MIFNMADGILTPCNVACGSGIMTVNLPSASRQQSGRWLWDDMPLNSPKRPPYCNSTSGFDFNHITAVDMSFCTSLRNFIQIRPPSAEKNDVMSISRWRRRISAILDFRGTIMGSFKSPCTASYRSSIETIALNCLVFEKIAFLHYGDRQTNRWTAPLHEAALAVASGGLIRDRDTKLADCHIFTLLLKPHQLLVHLLKRSTGSANITLNGPAAI